MTTPSIRQRFINSVRSRVGKKETFTRKVKDADISVKLDMLPASSAHADVEECARRIGATAQAKDEDGMLVDTFNKKYLPGESAAGIVRDLTALGLGLETEGEREEREAVALAKREAEAKAKAEADALAAKAEKSGRKAKGTDATVS